MEQHKIAILQKIRQSSTSILHKRYVNQIISAEISTITRYYDTTIQWLPHDYDCGRILDGLDCPNKSFVNENEAFPDRFSDRNSRTAIVLNGVFNHHYDIEHLLNSLKKSIYRTSRIISVMYNPYLSWLYTIATFFGLRKGPLPTTFITRTDLENILRLSKFELVRTRRAVYLPWRLFGIGDFLNKTLSLIPLIKWLSLTYIVVLRPIMTEQDQLPSLSCIIPARNEYGNIENAIKRLPDFPCKLEIIFVEGNSTDETWQEILRVKQLYGEQYDIKAFQQTGIGKSNAVRLGFEQASGDLLTILDADLTMPPELLLRFYQAYCDGHADFINGSRLVYPMEGDAMRFLNRLGNVFFARALSWVLDVRLGDSLCGTKLVSRHDYQRMIHWRKDFGDFDPFGDYELLFPAAILGLGIIDVPIRYRSRTYGETNISRFRHGLILLKMTLTALTRIKIGVVRKV
ncbi:MAG: glycosyltransferase family 2 protein [Thiohalomonadales bacterium]